MSRLMTSDELALSVISDGRSYEKRLSIARSARSKAARLNMVRTICRAQAIVDSRAFGITWNAAVVQGAAVQVYAHMAEHVAEFKSPGNHVDGDTYRTECGRGRTTYKPGWSLSQPWVTYIDGTAGRHFETLEAASEYFSKRKMSLVV